MRVRAAQYLAQFLPEKRYLATSVEFAVNGHSFIAKATKTTQDGWTAMLSGAKDNESDAEAETTPLTLKPLYV